MRLFPDFLVAALQRTIALTEVYRTALAVAQHLDFDVARLLEIFLEVNVTIAKSRLGLRRGGGHGEFQIGLSAGNLHAAPAAASGGLDDHRIANVLGDQFGFANLRNSTLRTGNHRNTQCLGCTLGLDLVAHHPDVLGAGPDELDPVLVKDLGEFGVLRQKSVTRMDGICPGDFAGRDDRRNVEIAVARRRRANAHALVGETHMHGIGISGRMHGHRLNAKLAAGAQHPEGDFATIGDEDFVEHVIRSPPAPRRIRRDGHCPRTRE